MEPNPQLERLLCDHESDAGPVVTHLRGTILVSSMKLLKEAGQHARYVHYLPAQVRDELALTLVQSWVPMELALLHYAACDKLALGDAELTKLGEQAAARYADTFLGTLLRTAIAAGVDAPWLALRSQARIWERIYKGGRIYIERTGPKDARMELYGLPLAQFRYFRYAFRGWYRGVGGMLCRKLYINFAPPRRPHPHAFAITGSWV